MKRRLGWVARIDPIEVVFVGAIAAALVFLAAVLPGVLGAYAVAMSLMIAGVVLGLATGAFGLLYIVCTLVRDARAERESRKEAQINA